MVCCCAQQMAKSQVPEHHGVEDEHLAGRSAAPSSDGRR
jgi:hypothetical protein